MRLETGAEKQNNDTKHTARATMEWFRTKDIHVLEWLSQKSRPKSCWESVATDLKITDALHSITEMEPFCKDEWENTAVSWCAKLIETYLEWLAAVIAVKCGLTKYWLRGAEYIRMPHFSDFCLQNILTTTSFSFHFTIICYFVLVCQIKSR